MAHIERDPTDLFPETEDEYSELRTWALDAMFAGFSARTPHEEKWDRYDKLWEAYIKRDVKDWRSKVFMPEVFQQIETIKPRLISQLPDFLVEPVGREDAQGADLLERLMDWAARNSKLHLELVKVFHPTLLYGTGILKTFPDTQYSYGSEMVPIFREEMQITHQPLIDPETQRQMLDINDQPMFETIETPVQVPVGMEPRKKRFVSYDGPAARAVNIRNIWPSPEAEDVQSARYLIHRSFRDKRSLLRLIKEGYYRVKEDFSEDDLYAQHQDPRVQQMEALDMGPGTDWTRKQLEVMEIWTNDGPDSPGRVITLVNRREIVRVRENPFWHGHKPFIRFVDYLKPNHFWGVGEVQHMEGIQDAINAIVNQRIDAGRLDIDQGYIVNTNHIEDRAQLKRRPGQVIEVTQDGLRPDEVIAPIPKGGIPEHAFAEVQSLQQMGERTTSVSSYQQGVDTPAQLETATGAAIMSEAGSSRFALKAKIFEIDPLSDLAMHFGSILQQFITTERVERLVGPDGAMVWETIDPASLQGRYDFTVSSMTAQQSETVKRQQALDVFNQVAQAAQMGVLPPQVVQVAVKELLETMGAQSILKAMEEAMAQQQQMAQQMPMEQLPEGVQ